MFCSHLEPQGPGNPKTAGGPFRAKVSMFCSVRVITGMWAQSAELHPEVPVPRLKMQSRELGW